MKGEISKEHTVWCGICMEWHQSPVNTKARMAREARRLGWKKTKKHGWVCPRCVKEKKDV